MKQKNRKSLVISISLRADQVSYINSQMEEGRDRSRWIRLAVDQRIQREKNGPKSSKSN